MDLERIIPFVYIATYIAWETVGKRLYGGVSDRLLQHVALVGYQ